ncbi:hypothetical protein LWI28_022661 [Acer negundo]|uniref:Xylanase inhibitor C-terminal domain-containing protein n=1 Tax=Acer negundo TaxID=4023 RepID=A0AAD5NQQ5_ACENE|nr:hypothetical protein LWI28_022661 [Acer negundo]
MPGIVGLTNHKSSLVGQLDFSSFSYCVSANESFHGQMRFGSAAIVSGPSTKIAPNQAGNYYFQNVEGLYVDGEKVEGIPDWVFKFVESSPGAGGFLIDTGSSVSVFPSVAFDPLIEKLKKHMRSRGGIAIEPDQSLARVLEGSDGDLEDGQIENRTGDDCSDTDIVVKRVNNKVREPVPGYPQLKQRGYVVDAAVGGGKVDFATVDGRAVA